MKNTLLAAILSFAAGTAGAAFTTATFANKSSVPLAVAQSAQFVSQASPIIASSTMQSSGCFEIVGGEQLCR